VPATRSRPPWHPDNTPTTQEPGPKPVNHVTNHEIDKKGKGRTGALPLWHSGQQSNWSTEQQSNRATEQQSNRATEQQSNRATEQQSNRATERQSITIRYSYIDHHDGRPTRTSWSTSYIDSLYTRQFLRISILSRPQDT
jgi:hypothetical protein